MEISEKTKALLEKHQIPFNKSLFSENKQCDGMQLVKMKQNIVVEARRVILNEQLDRIVDMNLCDLYTEEQTRSLPIECARCSPPPPPPNTSLCKAIKICNRMKPQNHDLIEKLKNIENNKIQRRNVKNLQRKYFNIWRTKVKNVANIENKQLLDENKLETFFEMLKLEKDMRKAAKTETKSAKIKQHCVRPTEKYENRFNAQKTVILMQRDKLLEQERVIEELKYGKICADLEKSIEESKRDLRELAQNISSKTKSKVGMVVAEPKENIEMKGSKASKLVKQMEARAKEREAKRRVIQERKQLLDEEKKRIAQEIIDNKRAQDEEEKKRNLEAIKERRRKELQQEKLRQINKKNFELKCEKAQMFYNRKLKHLVMNTFKKLITVTRTEEYKSVIFYEMSLEAKYFKRWREVTALIKDANLSKAKALYEGKLAKKCLDGFIVNYLNYKQNIQVATDYYEMGLMSRVLKAFQMRVCEEKMRRYKLYIKAVSHYRNRMLVQYFYQWRTLKAVLQLERTKEDKKRKWREKVWEIIPDFRPPMEDDY